MWHLPRGDLIMAGEGHKDWVAGISFHPKVGHWLSGACAPGVPLSSQRACSASFSAARLSCGTAAAGPLCARPLCAQRWREGARVMSADLYNI